MCGICGIVWNDRDRPVDPELIDRMTAALAHRGPDGAGIHREPGVALGHRRLSIIDIACGAQPLSNEDGTIWVVFNGEIYNFRDLRRQLESAGHRFRTHSDTEVLVHLYEECGPNLVDRLRGMFAFALWDSKTRTLLLARDRLGKKPLVYREETSGLRFASELKSLLTDPKVSRDIDPAALDEYLTYQYIPPPRTIFRSIRKLPPAHVAIWREGKLDIQRYWQPPLLPERTTPSQHDVEALRATLEEAVRIRLVSDVPLGAFLSGGVDSTIIVGLMQRHVGQPARTFSIGFPVREYDESSFAREASRHLKTDHREFHVTPDAVAVAHDLARFYDEPFADSSAIPTYYLAKMTRRHVTVALTGDGGDELFLGYDRYQAVRWAEAFDRLPRILRRLGTARVWRRLPTPGRQKSKLRRAQRLLEVLNATPEARYRQLVSIFSPERRRRLYSPEFARELAGHDSAESIESVYRRLSGRDFLSRTSFVDLVTYLPGDILTKVDMASMAHGLECRSPMLDQEVVELVLRMPLDRKLRGRRTKVILKEAFADLLPPSIQRRAKMGFGVPLDHWFRGPLRSLLVQTLGCDSDRGWFERKEVDRLVSEHLSGRWDHSSRLWALFLLELWARNYLDRRGS